LALGQAEPLRRLGHFEQVVELDCLAHGLIVVSQYPRTMQARQIMHAH
jgi:hypothetical protein